MKNPIVWYDIPVKDLDRAHRFYEGVLQISLKREDMLDMKMSTFPGSENGGMSGCLFVAEGMAATEKPADHGILLYFSVGGRLDEAVSMVDKLGGKVLMPKHQIGEYGWRVIILDSEGNRIALHSM